MARPPGILPSGCAGGLRGFPTAHPCTGGKLARIHAGHPADFPPPTRRTIGAPGKAARSQRAFGRSRYAAAKARRLIDHATITGLLGRWLWLTTPLNILTTLWCYDEQL